MEVLFDCRIERNEKCTRSYVRIVVKNVRFLSNLTEADQYTAENAILNEDHKEEDIRLIS